MSDVINIKAHLRRDGKVKEMRRFEVRVYGGYYPNLVNTIRDLFKVSSFKLRYQDSDGDMVVFSTNDELRHAVKFSKDNILYVHIYPKNNRTVQGNELVLATKW